MSSLRICLFGGVRIAHGEWPAEMKTTRAVRSLLAYLLLNRHRIHPREVLVGIFWGDHSEDRARGCLNTALWRLRQVLEPRGIPKGTYLLTTPMGEVGFNRESDHWLDVEVFEERVSRVLKKPCQLMEAEDLQKLENSLQLYIGELLEGFYDDWALRERERLRTLYLNSLAHLMRYYRYQEVYERSLLCGQQILYHDPLREEVHREVMRLYMESGQRALAMRQYETCRRILGEELGVSPMEETQDLYAELVKLTDCQANPSSLDPHQDFSRSVERTAIIQAFQKIHLAMRQFEKSTEELHRAVKFLEKTIKGRDPS